MPDSHGHSHSHDHAPAGEQKKFVLPEWAPLLLCALLLALTITLDYTGTVTEIPIKALLYTFAWMPVGARVTWKALQFIFKGDPFNEFFLMSLATLCALGIGEYEEGVAVMLFYELGELVQNAAVKRSKRSIKALLDARPETVKVLREGQLTECDPATVAKGDIIRVMSGEKIGLDGELVSLETHVNAAALTGEPVPLHLKQGDSVLAGMINEGRTAEIRVTAVYRDSRFAKILSLVQEAALHKSPTERFIRRFARIYTPAVVFFAAALTTVPMLFDPGYQFQAWLYRALIFLVISCPCALLISIPLSYFGGIGLAGRRGILLKGGNYLDQLRKINTLLLDKTGTLTEGKPRVLKVIPADPSRENELLTLAPPLAKYSSHPLSKAISVKYPSNLSAESAAEKSSSGLVGRVNGRLVILGSEKWMRENGVTFDPPENGGNHSMVFAAADNEYLGCFQLGDKLRNGVEAALAELRKGGLDDLIILSGDNEASVAETARQLGISRYYAGLMPEDKYELTGKLISEGRIVAFVGDGINDAPALARAHAGIALGGMSSDAAIETADVVVHGEDPGKIAEAIRISHLTHSVVIQNIVLAFGVKLLVLGLGAGGIATLWEAVFADVGVALLAILNAARLKNIQKV